MTTTKKPTKAFTDAITKTDNRIRVVRTIAPAAWAAVLLFVFELTGIDLIEWIGDLTELNPARASSLAQLVTTAVLYIVAISRPGWLEQLILLVKVEDTTYTLPEEKIAA